MEYSGVGDARKSLALLWGRRPERGRGPCRRLTVEQITETALAMAVEEGLEALSMRRLAERLGVTAMSLYKYIPGKAELLDLMVDTVYGRMPLRRGPSGNWRAQLEGIARENQALYRQHPWLLQVSSARPVLGPHALAKYEHELQALDGLGLEDVDMDTVLSLLLQFVAGAMRSSLETQEVRRRTGLSDEQWWLAHVPWLEAFVEPARYPLASRVGTASGQAHGGPSSPEQAFELGLRCLLDGIERLIDAPGAARS